jgi:hypothetical protein
MDMYFVLQGIFLVAKIREMGRRDVDQIGMLKHNHWCCFKRFLSELFIFRNVMSPQYGFVIFLAASHC